MEPTGERKHQLVVGLTMFIATKGGGGYDFVEEDKGWIQSRFVLGWPKLLHLRNA